MNCLISFLKLKHKYRFRGHNMCSIVYSSYIYLSTQKSRTLARKTHKLKIKHILHFPHVSKLHQLAPALLARAGGDVCPVSGQVLIRHLKPIYLP